jgi:hypothetical protein
LRRERLKCPAQPEDFVERHCVNSRREPGADPRRDRHQDCRPVGDGEAHGGALLDRGNDPWPKVTPGPEAFTVVAVLALPEGPLEYAAAAIVGGLMLALNLLRVGLGAPVRWLSVALGGSMVIAGSAALAGIEMDIFVLFFGLAGAITIAGALRR